MFLSSCFWPRFERSMPRRTSSSRRSSKWRIHGIRGRQPEVTVCICHQRLKTTLSCPLTQSFRINLALRKLQEISVKDAGSSMTAFRGPHKIPHSRRRATVANFSKLLMGFGSSGRTRTYNPSVNSRMLCH